VSDQLSAQYQPQQIEAGIWQKWMQSGAFSGKAGGKPPERRFSMVIPPPNVTGALHLGHAINATLQDILARWHRMRGDDTLWIPGIDHAGIATQAVVERTIFEQEKLNRHDLGREELVKRIWEWKEKFGDRILLQLQAMGASCDWDRTRFTLDDVCAKAVREAFFKLYKDGLIFRGLRLVNWDTHLQTAVADDEIYHDTVQGQMVSIRYPIVDRKADDPEYLVVATTRPETMLGDTALAVHPDDERYIQLIGGQVEVPLVGRKIPIIADGLLVDPKFGTGVVKVTPAHDPNDYATGQRQKLAQINLLTPDGKVNANGKGEFRSQQFNYEGLKFASEARKRVTEDLEKLGLIEKVEPHEHEVGHSDRSKTPIEPYLSEQWFVKMGDVEGGITLGDGTKASGLAQAAIDAVKSGRVKITPERYAQGYIDWLSQKRDWCISRQLWWGHRIPVWTFVFDSSDKNTLREAKLFFEEFFKKNINSGDLICETLQEAVNKIRIISHTNTIDKKLEEMLQHSKFLELTPVGKSKLVYHTIPEIGTAERKNWDFILELLNKFNLYRVTQDPDVLDTWFSSALWPLSTLGWPANGTSDKPEDQLLPYFYPTSVLSTAREILTLWVARMVMFGLYCNGEVPFKQVYIHAVIQDGQGRPMKKSLGNGVDPLDIIESHGADALRYTLASMATETQDIRLPVIKDKLSGKNTSPRFDVGRNFANKIWNAARFILSNVKLDKVPEMTEIVEIAQKHMEDQWILFELNETVRKTRDEYIKNFRFADLCITLHKFFWNDLCDWYLEIAKSRIKQGDQDVQKMLLFCLDYSLSLLHPVMPFITEELWQKLPGNKEGQLLAKGKQLQPIRINNYDAVADVQYAIEVTRCIRNIRNQYNVDLKKTLNVTVQTTSAEVTQAVQTGRSIIEPLSGAVLEQIGEQVAKPADAATGILPGMGMRIFVAGVIDREAEKKKLSKRREELEKLIASSKTKLGNEGFVNKAPAPVIQGLKDQLSKHESELAAVENSLNELAAA
jgi:valyl-tRNA synthetase